MSDLTPKDDSPDKTIPTTPINNFKPNGVKTGEKTPAQIVQEFLDDQGFEIRLSPPHVRNMEDGGLLIEQPIIMVNLKQSVPTPTISKN